MEQQNLPQLLIEMIEDIWLQFHQVEKHYIPFQLNKQQEILLTYILRHPRKSPSFFAGQMGISKSAISQLINKLESQQFVKRIQLTEDKRSIVLDLDENGKKYQEAYDQFYKQFSDHCNVMYTENELHQALKFFEGMQTILNQLKIKS